MLKRNIQPYTLAFITLLVSTLLTFYILSIIKEIHATQVKVIAVKNDSTASKMLHLTNMSRSAHNLPTLVINEKLTKAARKKAKHMFEFQYFDHNSPQGATPWEFIKAEHYHYKYAGENLAINFSDVYQAHSALMKSIKHKDNILNNNYTEIGIAIEKGIMHNEEVFIIVCMFGKPTL